MDSDCSDRLSELPDCLILEILSLLQMRYVVATMLLSKRWKHLWTTVPCLRFVYYYYRPSFVNGALSLWKGSKLLKFEICFVSDDITSDFIDSWLLFVMEKQVEELLLYNGPASRDYCAPQRLYSCSSITKLCLFSSMLKMDESVQWNQLRSLNIYGSKSLSEHAMNLVLSGAPLLEELILLFSEISENLSIQSTSLKKLQIGTCCGTVFKALLRVEAPNLMDLEISGFSFGTCLLNVPSLTNAILCFNESCYLDDQILEDSPPVEMFHQVFRSMSS